jgi:hypothetical protein
MRSGRVDPVNFPAKLKIFSVTYTKAQQVNAMSITNKIITPTVSFRGQV